MGQLCGDAMGSKRAILPLTLGCLSLTIHLLCSDALHWAVTKTQAVPWDLHRYARALIKGGSKGELFL